VDTIRVFASTDRQLTTRIRQSVGSSEQSGLNQGVIVGKPLTQLVSLRNELVGGMTRGLITVSDEPVGQPSANENTQAIESPYQGGEFPQQADVGGALGGEQNLGYEPGVPVEAEAVDPLQAIPVQQPVADWTAASVTVLVQP
jgi:hypothetical protein